MKTTLSILYNSREPEHRQAGIHVHSIPRSNDAAVCGLSSQRVTFHGERGCSHGHML